MPEYSLTGITETPQGINTGLCTRKIPAIPLSMLTFNTYDWDQKVVAT